MDKNKEEACAAWKRLQEAINSNCFKGPNESVVVVPEYFKDYVYVLYRQDDDPWDGNVHNFEDDLRKAGYENTGGGAYWTKKPGWTDPCFPQPS